MDLNRCGYGLEEYLLPIYFLKMISSTFCTICKLFEPLFSLVPKCDFSMFTNKCRVYSYGYIWIVTPTLLNTPPLAFLYIRFVCMTFFFSKSFLMIAYCQANVSWMKSPKYLYCEKKITVTESNKAGREGGLSKCLCTDDQIQAIRQGNSCFQF